MMNRLWSHYLNNNSYLCNCIDNNAPKVVIKSCITYYKLFIMKNKSYALAAWKSLSIMLLSCLALSVQAQKHRLQEPEFAGYLFAYFEGGGNNNLQEQLRFAVS